MGLVSIMMFLPCVFKEYSSHDVGISNRNIDNVTTETVNISEAEERNDKDVTKPQIEKKGKGLNFYIDIKEL